MGLYVIVIYSVAIKLEVLFFSFLEFAYDGIFTRTNAGATIAYFSNI